MPRRIVCVGASLTAGYPCGPSYADVLLKRYAATKLVDACDAMGVCGETTGEMVRRFQRDILPRCGPTDVVFEGDRTRYTDVVFLGGTNDLGCGVHPSMVVANLRTMGAAAQAAGCNVVFLTIPPLGKSLIQSETVEEQQRRYFAPRFSVNELIGSMACEIGAAVGDLYTATVDPATHTMLPELDGDGLHFNEAGYTKMAEVAAEALGLPKLA